MSFSRSRRVAVAPPDRSTPYSPDGPSVGAHRAMSSVLPPNRTPPASWENQYAPGMLRDPPGSQRSLIDSTGTTGGNTIPLGQRFRRLVLAVSDDVLIVPRVPRARWLSLHVGWTLMDRLVLRWLRHFRAIRRDERGAAAAELVLAMPLLFLLILLIAQFTLYLHASHIAQAAASEALSVTRVEGGTVGAGQSDAQRILSQLASGPLQDPHVTVTRNATNVTVQIDGAVTAVVPFLHLTASGEADGAVERFVPADAVTRSSQSNNG
jgi:hypothetical protein